MNEDKSAQSLSNCSFNRSPTAVRVGITVEITFSCSAPVSFSGVHQGDTKPGSSSLSSAVEPSGRERINISQEAIQCVDPLVPVYNLAPSQDMIMQENSVYIDCMV